jgi:hypothetical protein
MACYKTAVLWTSLELYCHVLCLSTKQRVKYMVQKKRKKGRRDNTNKTKGGKKHYCICEWTNKQTNTFTVANFNFKLFTLKYSAQQFKIKTVTCHMFKGMESQLSSAVNCQKIKFWSTVNWVKQCESHKYNKKNTKMDLRLACFGCVLSPFLGEGRRFCALGRGSMAGSKVLPWHLPTHKMWDWSTKIGW